MSGWTTTDRVVVEHTAFSSNATSSWARISAFLIVASFVQWTFRVCHTLGAASRWATNEAWHARAHSLIVDLTALAVRTAR